MWRSVLWLPSFREKGLNEIPTALTCDPDDGHRATQPGSRFSPERHTGRQPVGQDDSRSGTPCVERLDF
jgi:hypothetical protein